MNQELYSVNWDTRLRMQAWTYSLMLHGLLIGLALLLGTQLTLLRPDDPFRWDVALVEPAPPTESAAPPQPTAAAEAPAKPAHRPPKPITHPTPQPTPVERRVETAAQPIVQQLETRKQEHILERRVETTDAPRQTERPSEVRPSTQEMTPVAAPAPSLVQQPTQVMAAGPPPTERVVETVPARPVEEIVERAEPLQQSAPQSASVVQRTEPTVTEQAPPPVVQQPAQAPAVVQSQAPADLPVETPPVNHSAARDENFMVAKAPPISAPAARPDFSWLTDLLQRRSAEVRHYPSQARLNQWQGKVVVRAVIRADGHLADVTVKKSSGHPILDEAAMDVIRRITPIPLKYALGRQEVVVNIPISYELN